MRAADLWRLLVCRHSSSLNLPFYDHQCMIGRWLLNKFDKEISKGEGCVVIRTLGSVVIARAEKAVALQPLLKNAEQSSAA